MTRSRCRLAILASHPIQYFTPIYRRLAQHPKIDLDVMFYRDYGVRARYDEQFGRAIEWDTDQLSGYSYRFLTNLSPVSNTFNPLHAINPGAFSRLLRGFDAVWLNGYMYPSNWMAAMAASLRGLALLHRSELRLASDRTAKYSDTVRDRIIRSWVRRSDALLYIGSENRQAYEHYGATPDQLFFTPYSADVHAIRAARQRALADPIAARKRWEVTDDKIILLFAGKLTPRKHPEAFLELAAASRIADRVHLLFAGSGPLEHTLKSAVRQRAMTNVSFLGFVNQSVLPEVYAIADVFVMPSEREPWGVVVNEAMAAGAVPVVSDAVGAAPDLVLPMRTGMQFPSGDWSAMREAVTKLVMDDSLRRELSRAAAKHVAKYDHDNAAQGVVHALSALGLLDDTVPKVAAPVSSEMR